MDNPEYNGPSQRAQHDAEGSGGEERGSGDASALRELVTGAGGWLAFRANAKGRFEGRVCGARVLVVVAYGEGQAGVAGA
ncbi:hypothetical protein HDZ31DRAFT_70656 [Schizophyllum fasciatum]